MGPLERTVATTVHGTYLVEPPAGSPAGPPLLVGFHGYAETAARHLEELRRIPGAAGWLLCAVQALHPFYNRANEVAASWMTRHDRERAIADNVAYVAAVVSELEREFGAGGPLVFAGFSQGAAMAYRAASRAASRAAAGSGQGCAGVIVLGGDLPPELLGDGLAGFPPVLVARGREDTWFDQAKMARDLEALKGRGVEVLPLVFAGAHEWTDEFRRAAGDFLGAVLSA